MNTLTAQSADGRAQGLRAAIRAGRHTTVTSGAAPGPDQVQTSEGQPAGGQEGGPPSDPGPSGLFGGGGSMWIWMILLLIVFWVILFGGQRREKKKNTNELT